MQNDSATSFPDRETIELPELPAERRPRSAVAPAIIWMAILLAGAGATYAMVFHGVAQASGAMRSEDPSSSTPRDSARLSAFLSDGQSQLPAMRAAMSQCGQTLRALMTYAVRPQIPQAALKRNPFHQPDPLASASHAPATANPTTQPHPEAERAAMLQAVEAMQLQSIACTDSHRSCMINNVLYDEAGIINGFTIEQINSQTVVIRNGLYRFELTMNR